MPKEVFLLYGEFLVVCVNSTMTVIDMPKGGLLMESYLCIFWYDTDWLLSIFFIYILFLLKAYMEV